MRLGTFSPRRFLHLFGAGALAGLTLLGPLVPAAWAQPVRVGGTGSALEVMRQLGEAHRLAEPQFELTVVPNLGSSGGMRALAAGAIEAALVTRELTEEERRAGLTGVAYGRTPVVLATSRQAAAGFSARQVEEIYAGRQERWPDGLAIRLVLRPLSDVDTRVLGGLSARMPEILKQAAARPGMLVPVTDQDSANDLARLPGSLGTSSLALLLAEKRGLTILPIDGVMPSARTVADGSYPLAKTMFIVYRGDAPAQLRRYIDFLKSPRARALLEQTGHWVPPAR